MKNIDIKQRRLLPTGKTIVAGLVIAAAGVILQIMAGAPYPAIPPVFFILLVPAGLIAFGKWPWTVFLSLLATLFLTMGLFRSGAYHRLFTVANPGDSIGLWIQFIAVLLAMFASVPAIIRQIKKPNAQR